MVGITGLQLTHDRQNRTFSEQNVNQQQGRLVQVIPKTSFSGQGIRTMGFGPFCHITSLG